MVARIVGRDSAQGAQESTHNEEFDAAAPDASSSASHEPNAAEHQRASGDVGLSARAAAAFDAAALDASSSASSAPSAEVLAVAVATRLRPLGDRDVETHVYSYHSSEHGEGTLILTRRRSTTSPDGFSQRVEWISRSLGLTASHGDWRIDEQGRLVLNFNCREGTLDRKGLQLHTTLLWKEMRLDTVPDDYSAWGGWDDKKCNIGLKHTKSFMEVKEIGKSPQYLSIPQL